MIKDCAKNKILNPKTNRCVNINGKIGKSILAQKTKDCAKNKILNPKTNRCVNINGKIGKSILAQKETKKINFNIKFPLNHSLNEKQIEKYINACDIETREILRKIFKNTIHISFENFIRNLNKNIKNLINYIQKKEIIFFYINEEEKDKSNNWLYKYIENYINYYYPEKHILTISNLSLIPNNAYIIFVDDCIYSGIQMSGNITNLKNIKTDNKINAYLLCSYISSYGLNKINKLVEKLKLLRNINFHINSNVNDIPLINDYLTKEEIEILNKYTGIDMSNINGKYLIYFDHKLADTISTITHIYSGYVLNKHNLNIYSLMTGNEETDLEYYEKLDIIPIIKNCENIRNYDLFKPLCPYTPYKISFNSLIQKFKLNQKIIKSI